MKYIVMETQTVTRVQWTVDLTAYSASYSLEPVQLHVHGAHTHTPTSIKVLKWEERCRVSVMIKQYSAIRCQGLVGFAPPPHTEKAKGIQIRE